MKAFRNRQRIANWREDKNGLLTVTVCVLKEGVYPYGADECEGLPDTLAGRGTVMEFIPAAEFTPEAMKTLEGKRYKVDRSKGLGENDPEMMWLTTMNPETRRLIKVMPEDAEATAQVFDLLLGDNLQGRKDHIAENGYKYLELADIS